MAMMGLDVVAQIHHASGKAKWGDRWFSSHLVASEWSSIDALSPDNRLCRSILRGEVRWDAGRVFPVNSAQRSGLSHSNRVYPLIYEFVPVDLLIRMLFGWYICTCTLYEGHGEPLSRMSTRPATQAKRSHFNIVTGRIVQRIDVIGVHGDEVCIQPECENVQQQRCRNATLFLFGLRFVTCMLVTPLLFTHLPYSVSTSSARLLIRSTWRSWDLGKPSKNPSHVRRYKPMPTGRLYRECVNINYHCRF